MNGLIWIAGGLAALAVLVRVRRQQHQGPTLSRPPTVEFQGALRAIREGRHPGLEQYLVEVPGVPQIEVGLTTTSTGRDPTQPGARPARSPSDAAAPAQASTPAQGPERPPPHIFRKYDIRGLADVELSVKAVQWIGSAIGTEIREQGRSTALIGRDARDSGTRLIKALVKGLMLTGVDAINLGKVPTPMLYLAQHQREIPDGIMLTASHNGPEYNGLKIVIGNEPLYGERIQALLERIRTGAIKRTDQRGTISTLNFFDGYIETILKACQPGDTNFKVVVDCANGMAGPYLPFILRKLGHTVEELYCELDGNFPNHPPDPGKAENLEALAGAVQEHQADLGLALDGDGDRVVAMDANGKPIWPDRLMMLFARDLLGREPGATIIHDVKSTRGLPRLIEELGGKAIMSPCGHSVIRNRMQELDSRLGGELSGHIFFRENWYGFDDAIYAACRLLELLSRSGQTPTEVFNALPGDHTSPEYRVEMQAAESHQLLETLSAHYQDHKDVQLIRIDGLRVEYPDRWGVVRASNTSAMLSMRFEGDNPKALEDICTEFRNLLTAHSPGLVLPF